MRIFCELTVARAFDAKVLLENPMHLRINTLLATSVSSRSTSTSTTATGSSPSPLGGTALVFIVLAIPARALEGIPPKVAMRILVRC